MLKTFSTDLLKVFIETAFLQQARYGNVEMTQQLFVHIKESVDASVRKTDVGRYSVGSVVDGELSRDADIEDIDEDVYDTADDRSDITDASYHTARSSATSSDERDEDGGDSDEDGSYSGEKMDLSSPESFARRYSRAMYDKVKETVFKAIQYGQIAILHWLVRDVSEGGVGISLDYYNNDFFSYFVLDYMFVSELRTPLAISIQYGQLATLKWLLSSPDSGGGGGGLSFPFYRREKMVFFAIRHGQIATLKWLLQEPDSEDGGGGFSLDVIDVSGIKPLLVALKYGQLPMLQWLMQDLSVDGEGGDLTLDDFGEGVLPILEAAFYGQIAVLRWLKDHHGLSLDVKEDKRKLNPVLKAVEGGEISMLRWLLQDPEAEDGGGGLSLDVTSNYSENPVLVAVGAGKIEMLRWLLQDPSSADGGGGLSLNVTEAKQRNPVLIAVAEDNLDMLKWLITPKVQGGGGLSLETRDKFGHNPVLQAIFSGRIDMLKWLLQPKSAAGDGGGLSLYVKTKWVANPVIMAAHYGQLDILKWLVKAPGSEDGGKGASLDTKEDNQGRNPVLEAVAYGHIETVKWLIKPSASVGGGGNLSLNVIDKYSHNPVLTAVSYEMLEMLKWLIRSREEGGGGLSLTTRSRSGFDVVILAAYHNKIAMLRWLVADAPEGGEMAVDTQDRSGKTAIQYAKEKEHHDVLEFLFERGLEQITDQRVIDVALDWGRENLKLDAARLKPLLIAFIKKSLTALLEAKQLDVVERVYQQYFIIEGDNATMVMADFYQQHGYYSKSYNLYHQLWSEKGALKEEAGFHIANLIWLGYIDVYVEDGPFEAGLAGEHTYGVDDDRKREILTARAIQAYYFIGESLDLRNQEFKERFDQILAGNYSPGVFASSEWSERSKRLFQHFHMAMAPDFVGRKQMLAMFKY